MPLFDPLRTIQDMHVTTTLKGGRVVLEYDAKHSPESKEQAWAIRQEWEWLLKLQIETGASVQKLVAHGKVKAGECVQK